MNEYFLDEYGNAGSRTHDRGQKAKKAVQEARRQVASIVDAAVEGVVFTSGATESNNISILGLAEYGRDQDRLHVITSEIEHKAVLEPMQQLAEAGFDVTLLPSGAGGAVDPAELEKALRPETVLVSMMHVNNETGVIQPIDEVASILQGHDAYFHVDAAQSFGKLLPSLKNKRIDLISASAHKIYGPKGVGALIMRRRHYSFPPLKPLAFGGGQERGLRPGTQPVPLIAGFGEAAKLAARDHEKREMKCQKEQHKAMNALDGLDFKINGDLAKTISHTLNISITGIDSEATMLCLKGIAELSNGSACTSASYEPSHVLRSMGFDEDRINSAIRLSWCHMTEDIPWREIVDRISRL